MGNGVEGRWRDTLKGVMSKVLEVMDVFFILTVVTFSWVYTYVKTYIAHSKYNLLYVNDAQ